MLRPTADPSAPETVRADEVSIPWHCTIECDFGFSTAVFAILRPEAARSEAPNRIGEPATGVTGIGR